MLSYILKSSVLWEICWRRGSKLHSWGEGGLGWPWSGSGYLCW